MNFVSLNDGWKNFHSLSLSDDIYETMIVMP
jgi:hypothetical protein